MIGILGRIARAPRRFKRIWFVIFFVVLAGILSGCQTLSYYTQAIHGQYQILHARQPIPKVIANPKTSPELRERLQFVVELRQFAAKELKLPVDGNYADYADLKRKYVVWDIYAAPEFSLQPKTWRYPFVGSLEYRGYFSEKSARKYADKLLKQGYDVYVSGIPAYSTLGWFKDPILNTFVFDPKNELADTLFHELAHHRVFADGDTEFNEAFATAVGEEGVRRWLLAHNDPKAWETFRSDLQHDKGFVALILATRTKLAGLYAKFGQQQVVNVEQERQQKAQLFQQMRDEYQKLRAEWGGYSGYDKWFSTNLNNAKLNTVSAYYKWVPAFRHLLQKDGGDLEKFYEDVKVLSKLPLAERHAKMDELLRESKTDMEKAT